MADEVISAVDMDWFGKAMKLLRKCADLPRTTDHPQFSKDLQKAIELLSRWETDSQARESRQREGRQLRLREVRRADQQLNDEEARAAKISRLRRGE